MGDTEDKKLKEKQRINDNCLVYWYIYHTFINPTSRSCRSHVTFGSGHTDKEGAMTMTSKCRVGQHTSMLFCKSRSTCEINRCHMGLNREVGKMCVLQPIFRRISETVRDRAKVPIDHK